MRRVILLAVGDGEARADGQGGELIDGIAAGTPVSKLLSIEVSGHVRMPFAGLQPDHRPGIMLTADPI